ncbi:MAG: nucleotidyltransferase domain-containing protein [Sedimentisphaerales bacterium]|nr:nucleotidyltransferase domain-containing protein [Sedimentisphaerales bacterium]
MAIDTIKLSDELQTRIREALAPLHPEKVILFGSYAWGQPTEDSDIDLYVVTQDDYIPASWREKRDIVRAVSNRILNLRTRYAIDLLVHTKPMHREFVAIDSSFARRIIHEGARLL